MYAKRADATENTDNTDNKDDDVSNDMLHTLDASVASYRDPECTATVEDLYITRRNIPNASVSPLSTYQRVPSDDLCSQPAVPCKQDLCKALCRYGHLLDVYDMDARHAVGPVFARQLAKRHYHGKYFALQLDSHVCMTTDWDTDAM
jgi:hypothetical protein